MKKLLLALLLLISASVFAQLDTINIGVDDFKERTKKINAVIKAFNELTTEKFNPKSESIFERMTFYSLSDNEKLERKRLINQAVDSLDHYNLFDTLSYLHLLSATNSEDAKVNWVENKYNLTEDNCPHIRDVGFKGNGFDAILNTNFKPALDDKYELNNSSMGVWLLSDIEENANVFGVTDIGVSFIAYRQNFDGLYSFTYHNNTSAKINILKKGVGLHGLNRKLAANYQYVYNGVDYGTAANASLAEPISDVALLTANRDGTNSLSSNALIAASYAGAALTDLQNQKLYEILNRYLTGVNALSYVYDGIFENEFFYYREDQNQFENDIEVIAENEEFKLASTGDSLMFSTDTGATYNYRILFDIDTLALAYTFSNGRIIIGTKTNHLLISNDSLNSFVTSGIKYWDSIPYTVHAPANPLYPGSYFGVLGKPRKVFIQGQEYMFHGNYGNANSLGANPTLVYLMKADADSISVIYEFGQNPNFTDNGTATGGTGGTLLGDAFNPIITRHIHTATYKNNDSSFWVFCGDGGENNRWMKGNYNGVDFNFQSIVTEFSKERFRTTGVYFSGDTVIWGSDASPIEEQGIFLCPDIARINDTLTHLLKFKYPYPQACYGLEGVDGKILAVWQAGGNVITYSNNNGVSFSDIKMKYFRGDSNIFLMNPKKNYWFSSKYLNNKSFSIRFK